MTIRTKLFYAFFSLCLLTAATGFIAIKSFRYIQESTDQAQTISINFYRTTDNLTDILKDIRIHLVSDGEKHIIEALNIDSPEELLAAGFRSFDDCIHVIENGLEIVRKEEDEKQREEEISREEWELDTLIQQRVLFQEFGKMWMEHLGLDPSQDDLIAKTRIREVLLPRMDALVIGLQDIRSGAINEVEQEHQQMNTEIKESGNTLQVTTLSALALGLALAWATGQGIMSPVRKLMEGIQGIKMGHFETRVDYHSHNEMGYLSDSFNTMAEELCKYESERQKHANILKAKERRYRNLFEGSSEAILLEDTNGLLDCNQAFLELFEYDSIQEIESFRMANFSPETQTDGSFSLEAAEAKRAKILQNGSCQYEWLHCKKSGNVFISDVLATRIPMENGWITQYIIRDITEHQKLLERQANHLAQLKHLSELSMMLSGEPETIFQQVVSIIGKLFKVRTVYLSEIIATQMQFRAVYVNGNVSSDTGSCPLANTPCATVKTTKTIQIVDRVQDHFPNAPFLKTHEAHSYCGVPSMDHNGRVVAVLCLLDDKPRDYTEEDKNILRVIGQRVAAELEQLASEKRYSLLVEDSPDAIGIVKDGKLVFINETGARLLGANDKSVLLNRPIQELIHPDDLPAAQMRIKRRLNGETEVYPAQIRYRRTDGTTLPMEVIATPIPFAGE